MGCNCTYQLRQDIIKRFFGNTAKRGDFANELIRIVECVQTSMSPELTNWFRTYFNFPSDLFGEFLRCVLKQQTSMSDELRKAIRARYFPADQKMADDFIRVVLCSCCPTLCGTGLNIINTSDTFSVDGWYLQVDDSNLVYMESNVITETVACESGLADFIISSGSVTAAPAVWHNDSWQPLITAELIGQDLGVSFTLTTTIEDWFTNPCAGSVQISTNGGVTWTEVGTLTNTQLVDGEQAIFDTTETEYIYRVIVTDTVTGCSYYNPAPDIGNASYCIDYVTIDVSTDPLFELLGSINTITPLDVPATYQPLVMATLADPYQTVAGAYGGFGVAETYGLSTPFYMQVLRPSTEATTVSIADILDSTATPVDTSPDGTNCQAKTYYGEFTVTDFNALYIDGLIINGGTVAFPEVQTPNLNDQTEFLSRMEERGLRDPAMTVDFHGTAGSGFSITLTTVMPVEQARFNEGGVSQIIVNLTEI